MSIKIFTILSILTPVLTTGCGNIFLKMTSGNKPQGSSSFKFDDASVLNDLKGRCGFTISEPLAINLNLKSLPAVIKTSDTNGTDPVDVEITIEATAQIANSSGKSEQSSEVKVLKIAAASKGVAFTDAAIDKIVRPKVLKEIKQNNSKGSSIPLSTFTLLKQTKEEGPYSGIFCSVGFSMGSISESQSAGEYSLSNPVPSGINPRAAAATYDLELGDSKSFDSVVTIKKAKTEWLEVGREIPVTVVVRKISTDLSKLSGLPKDLTLPQIKADVAYEITTKGPEGIPISKFGMTKRQAFFVDTESGSFSAIVNELDQTDPTKPVVPPIVLLPSGE